MIVRILVVLAIMVISHVRSDTLSKTEGLDAWLQSRQRSSRAKAMTHLVPMLALCGLFTVSRWPELAVDYPSWLSITMVAYFWALWAADIIFPPRPSEAGA